MLNHKFNACKSKSKSKIFITILCIFGLLFSYSCSCKNNVTGPGNDGLEDGIDTNTINSQTFSASVSGTVQDTLRVDSQSKKKAGTEDIKISFSAAKGVNTVENFLVTIEKLEVKDGGLELRTNADDYKNYLEYDKSTGTIQFQQKGLDAIGALISTTAPVDKIVSIIFKIDGGEQGSDYITRDFHLIKIKKIEEKDIQTILHKIDPEAKHPYNHGPAGNVQYALFNVNNGEYKAGIYEMTNETPEQKKMTTFESADITNIKEILDYYLPKLDEISGVKQGKEDGEAGKDNYYKVTYDITWGDNFESTITSIPFKYTL